MFRSDKAALRIIFQSAPFMPSLLYRSFTQSTTVRPPSSLLCRCGNITPNRRPLPSNNPAWVAQSVERVTLTICSAKNSLQDHLKVAGSSPASGSIPEFLESGCSINVLVFTVWWWWSFGGDRWRCGVRVWGCGRWSVRR